MAQCIKYFPQQPINLSSIPESHSQMKELTLEKKKKKVLFSSDLHAVPVACPTTTFPTPTSYTCHTHTVIIIIINKISFKALNLVFLCLALVLDNLTKFLQVEHLWSTHSGSGSHTLSLSPKPSTAFVTSIVRQWTKGDEWAVISSAHSHLRKKSHVHNTSYVMTQALYTRRRKQEVNQQQFLSGRK